jgi:hypothetical protein
MPKQSRSTQLALMLGAFLLGTAIAAALGAVSFGGALLTQ